MFVDNLRALFLQAVFARYIRILFSFAVLAHAISVRISLSYPEWKSESSSSSSSLSSCSSSSSSSSSSSCVCQNPREDSFRIRYYFILYYIFQVYQKPLNAGSGRILHSTCNVISSLNLLQKRPQKASKRASKRKPFLEAIFEPKTCNLLPELEESEAKDGKR